MKVVLVKILLILVGTVVFGLVSRNVIVPVVFQLSDDFLYSAELLSFDNFYNEAAKKFSGENRSVTTFSYATQSTEGTARIVANVFDVRSITGEKIIAIERLYGVDKQSWRHQIGKGDKSRSGHLFAPRHVQSDESFDYWHVNYDQKLTMQFDGEETVSGLKTYRYVSNFQVDQTSDLGHLPGVPEERGVNLDVNLTLWVEPVSGWLVKYEDSAIAYYYDSDTYERIHPWNQFRNTYSQASIEQQVDTARLHKYFIVFFEWILPWLIGVLLLAVVLARHGNRRLGLLVFVVGFLGAGLLSWFVIRSVDDAEMVVVGISRWVAEDNTTYDDNIQGFKNALADAGYVEHKNIKYIHKTANAQMENQVAIAREFVRDDVDLVYSLTTPGTAVIKDIITNRPVVFSIVTYPVEAGLIDSLTSSGNNLVGSRNWVPVEDQLGAFLELVPTVQSIGFVHRADEVNSNIQLVEMREIAENFGVEIIDISATTLQDLEEVLETHSEIDSIYSACDTLVQGEAEESIIDFVKRNNIPSFSCNISGPFKGDLLGVVADFYEIGQMAGEKASLILNGARPGTLETTTVLRPSIYINATRANELGIIIPQTLIPQAKEIIR